MTRGHAARRFEALVVRSARAKNNFVLRVILREECLEIRLKARVRSMQWLQEAQRRREAGPRSKLRQSATALAEEARNGPQHNACKDRRSDEAEHREAEDDVGHADNRITGNKDARQ